MNTLNIPGHVLEQIFATIGAAPSESGGIFAVSDENIVEKYYFDVHAGTGNRFYRPSAVHISEQVNDWLRKPGLRFGGYIHSHPAGLTTLSPMDIVAAEMNMYRNRLPWIYMLILCENRLYGYHITVQPEEVHASVESCSIRITT